MEAGGTVSLALSTVQNLSRLFYPCKNGTVKHQFVIKGGELSTKLLHLTLKKKVFRCISQKV